MGVQEYYERILASMTDAEREEYHALLGKAVSLQDQIDRLAVEQREADKAAQAIVDRVKERMN